MVATLASAQLHCCLIPISSSILRQIRRSIVSFLRDFQRMYSMLHSYKTKFHSHPRSSAVYLQTTRNSGGFLGGLDGLGHLLYSVFKSSINEELMKSGKFITDTRTHFFIHYQIRGSIKAMDEGTGSGSCGYFSFFILWEHVGDHTRKVVVAMSLSGSNGSFSLTDCFILPGKVYRKVTLSPNRWKHRVPLLSQQSHRSNGRHYMILCRSHLGSAEGFIFRLYPLVD